ncbi:hypothetical protein O3P69_013863 [Scylla paramamosain]|uniref:Ionotropic glutamate receptor L-glutamate and glycine-binding domain-containing protein n=1 Tax=Scylla paramamosain TaxID=85552 RepID=A0AAW0SQ77_SCYPA
MQARRAHPRFMAPLMLMVACVALLASLSIEEAPRPLGRGETLEAAGAAAAAVLARAWQPHCCVIMLTDGAASTHAVAKALRQMAAPWGAAVLEVPPGADGPKGLPTTAAPRPTPGTRGDNDSDRGVVSTSDSDRDVVSTVDSDRGVVSTGESDRGVVPTSDSDRDVVFTGDSDRGVVSTGDTDRSLVFTGDSKRCAAPTEDSVRGVSSTGDSDSDRGVVSTGDSDSDRGVVSTGAAGVVLVALTGLPKDRLRHLHSSFSHVNAVLIVSDGGVSPRCEVVVYLPYSEHELLVARWRRGRLTLASSLPLFPDKFHRFLERPFLRLTAEEFPPHVVMQYRAAPGGGTKLVFSGAMMSVLEVLAQSLNFSYALVRPPDGSFGTRLANGTATGMVGMVGRKEVDLGLGPFGITPARSIIVDYTAPVVNDYLRILAGRGRPEVDPWGFLLPLAPLVWVGLVVALVVVMAIVLLLARCVSLYPPALAPYVRVLLQESECTATRVRY